MVEQEEEVVSVVSNEDVDDGIQEAEEDGSPLSYRSGNAPSMSPNKRRSEPADFSDSDDTGANGEDGDAVFVQAQPVFEQAQQSEPNGFEDFHLSDDDDDDNAPVVEEEVEEVQEDTEDEPSASPAKAPPARSRAKGNSAGPKKGGADKGQDSSGGVRRRHGGRAGKQQEEEEEVEDTDTRPTKKAKTTSPLGPQLDQAVQDYANRAGPLKGRSLYILKRETPTDGSAVQTRSGRRSVRPLAYWRNERCVYGNEEAAEGQRFPLTTIKEVIRTEELAPERKKTGRKKGKSYKGKKGNNDSDDEDDKYLDPWEKEGGVLHGYIRRWDSEAQTGMDEEEILGTY